MPFSFAWRQRLGFTLGGASPSTKANSCWLHVVPLAVCTSMFGSLAISPRCRLLEVQRLVERESGAELRVGLRRSSRSARVKPCSSAAPARPPPARLARALRRMP